MPEHLVSHSSLKVFQNQIPARYFNVCVCVLYLMDSQSQLSHLRVLRHLALSSLETPGVLSIPSTISIQLECYTHSLFLSHTHAHAPQRAKGSRSWAKVGLVFKIGPTRALEQAKHDQTKAERCWLPVFVKDFKHSYLMTFYSKKLLNAF